MKCKYCNYVKNIGRAKAQGFNNWGRKYYYCKHSDRDKTNDFVGYGDNSYLSELTLKTCPRWCPLKKEAYKEKAKPSIIQAAKELADAAGIDYDSIK